MTTSPARAVLIVLAMSVGLLHGSSSFAHAADESMVLRRAGLDLSLLTPKPQVPAVAPIAGPIRADPAGNVRGTVILVHSGGWRGHDAYTQDLLYKNPGTLFLKRGWRVVSIDYEEGTAGLQFVLNSVGEELARKTGGGPVCVYGESAGGHLALVAASRLRAIDCVITLGAPTDINRYEAEGSVSGDGRVRLAAQQASRFFGTTPEQIAPWNPLTLAPKIHSDVLLMHESDDVLVPLTHTTSFQAARPTTQTVMLEAGDPTDPSTTFVHGRVSEAGRARYASAIGSFADRAVTAQAAENAAARTGCAQVNRSFAEAGPKKLSAALRCLARRDAKARRGGKGEWRRTSFRVRGESNAARIWTYLRGTKSGMRALRAVAERGATVTIRASDPSRVIVRVRR